ncbi:MAG: hypothetical protein COB53_06430 [Elusimicrobia bacterium]|nr:MAG: hypothetical protein COB53_06430 [Elusimicrobiota bacterium]
MGNCRPFALPGYNAVNCSHCKIPLRAYRVSGKEIDLCNKCGGAYYDQGELGIPVIVKDLKPAKINCPRCGLRMYIGHFGGKQGPELDYCTNCGGVWADKGELNKIQKTDSFAGPAAASAAAAAFTGRSEGSKTSEKTSPRPAAERIGKSAHKPPPYGPWTEYWDEFLLYNPEKGFAWLVAEGGHYTLERTTNIRPIGLSSTLSQKRTVDFGGQDFQIYDRGTAVLDEAEGETPWIAKPGDKFASTELIAPPRMVTIEKSKGEVEHFLGEYIEPLEVWKGFKLSGAPPERSWVHGAQKFLESDFVRQSKGWTLGFALIFAGLFGTALLHTQTMTALTQAMAPRFPEPVETKTFVIEKANTVCRINTTATLSNQWLWLGIDILAEDGAFAGEISVQMEEYHGVEGGYSWREGKNHTSAIFVIKDPGTYRLRIIGEGGSGQGGNSFNPAFQVEVLTDYVPWRFYLIGLFFTVFAVWWMYDHSWGFERKRWGEVIEEEDDDD